MLHEEIVLSIDPGGYTMGICAFNAKVFEDTSTVAYPIYAYSLHMSDKQRQSMSSNTAITKMISILQDIIEEFKVVKCYCEKPRQFAGSASSYAASIQGHLQMMDTFRGALLHLCESNGVAFIDVGVTDWKGNLPKNLVKERIREVIGNGTLKLSKNGHDWDACGIGLYVQGYFR